MVRKISKKKKYRKISKKTKVKRRKAKSKYLRKKKLLGGAGNNKELADTVRQVLREESNISKVGATKKKGLISSVLSNIPFVGNLMKEPEHLQALDLEKKQVQKESEKAEREAEESKSESNKYKEEIAESIKSGINDMTQPTKKKSFG